MRCVWVMYVCRCVVYGVCVRAFVGWRACLTCVCIACARCVLCVLYGCNEAVLCSQCWILCLVPVVCVVRSAQCVLCCVGCLFVCCVVVCVVCVLSAVRERCAMCVCL